MNAWSLVAHTRRRVPDVAFFDDGDSTVTIERPTQPAPPPPPPPPRQSFEQPPPPSFNFTPPTFTPNPALTEAQAYAIKAMKGQLDVPESLTQDLDRQQGILIQGLAKSLGPGWRTSAPGMQALSEFKARRTAAEDAARHGNPATTNAILQGLVQEDAFRSRNEFEAFQASVQFGLAEYKAQLEASQAEFAASSAEQLQAERIAAQNAQANAGRQVTTTKSGGGASALLGPAGAVLGMGAASIFGAKGKPWWLPDGERSGGTSSGVISPGFGDATYSLGGNYATDPLANSGGYNLGGSGLNLSGFDLTDFSGSVGSIGSQDYTDFYGGLDLGGQNYSGYLDPSMYSFNPSDYTSWFDPSQFSFDLGGLNLGDLGGGGGFSLGDLNVGDLGNFSDFSFGYF